jgi:hypothetical protein
MKGHDMEYLRRVPDALPALPADRILVHNRVRPAPRLGLRGFRAWLATPDEQIYEPCTCAWAPHLGTHYRVRLNELGERVVTRTRAAVCRALVKGKVVVSFLDVQDASDGAN